MQGDGAVQPQLLSNGPRCSERLKRLGEGPSELGLELLDGSRELLSAPPGGREARDFQVTRNASGIEFHQKSIEFQ